MIIIVPLEIAFHERIRFAARLRSRGPSTVCRWRREAAVEADTVAIANIGTLRRELAMVDRGGVKRDPFAIAGASRNESLSRTADRAGDQPIASAMPRRTRRA